MWARQPIFDEASTFVRSIGVTTRFQIRTAKPYFTSLFGYTVQLGQQWQQL